VKLGEEINHLQRLSNLARLVGRKVTSPPANRAGPHHPETIFSPFGRRGETAFP
jgi:hypothetical protein